MLKTRTRTVRQENLHDKHKLDQAEFHAAVYQIVQLIPSQRITSYSHVAKLIGMPKNGGRHVRDALKFLIHTTPPVPWHRVTSAAGILSTRNPIGGPNNIRPQRELLELEGVEVEQGIVGEMRVDFAKWGWFPEAVERVGSKKEKISEEEDWGA